MRHAVRDRYGLLIDGDVHMGTIGADVRLVPDSTTAQGAAGTASSSTPPADPPDDRRPNHVRPIDT